MNSGALHGIAAAFATPEALVAGLREVRRRGFTAVEVNTPFAVAGVDELLPGARTPIARVVLLGALVGAGGGYFLQWFAARDYLVNVGGRPPHSWPAFVPVTFELGVLCAVLAGVGALFWLCRLPRLDHPLFALRSFERASQDRYFLCVRAEDPRFERESVRSLLASLAPESISEVPA